MKLESRLNTPSLHTHRLCFPKDSNSLVVNLSAEKVSKRRKMRRKRKRIKPNLKVYVNKFISINRVNV